MPNSSIFDKLNSNKSMISGAPEPIITKSISFETIKKIVNDIKKHFKRHGKRR
jgi:hypothetical protein